MRDQSEESYEQEQQHEEELEEEQQEQQSEEEQQGAQRAYYWTLYMAQRCQASLGRSGLPVGLLIPHLESFERKPDQGFSMRLRTPISFMLEGQLIHFEQEVSGQIRGQTLEGLQGVRLAGVESDHLKRVSGLDLRESRAIARLDDSTQSDQEIFLKGMKPPEL